MGNGGRKIGKKESDKANHNAMIKIQYRMQLFALAFFPLLSISVAYGDEWVVDATVAQDLFYDDNVTMTEEPRGSFAYKIIPVVNLLHRTEVSEIRAAASYGTQVYDKFDALNQDIQKYDVTGNYLTERSQWGLAANYNVAPARDTAEEDSGVFASAAQKTSWSIGPSISYRLTELDNLILSQSYSETRYSSGNFSDNQSLLIDLAWQRQWAERYSSSLRVYYLSDDFENQGGLNVSQTNNETYGADVAGTYLISERWDVDGSVGIRRTDTEFYLTTDGLSLVNRSSSFGFLFDFGARFHGERLSAQLRFNRSLVPTAQGQLNQQTRAEASLQYELTPHLAADVGASYQISEPVGDEINIRRDNMNFQSSLRWRIFRDWTVVGSYRFRYQDSESRQQAVDSNLFMLAINYNWQGLSFSR